MEEGASKAVEKWGGKLGFSNMRGQKCAVDVKEVGKWWWWKEEEEDEEERMRIGVC